MPSRIPRVSVVLPVYNGSKWIAEAIRSIQCQTFEDWRLYVIDDGSTDDSLTICHATAAGDDRITVDCNPSNIGLAKTMNRLVAASTGEYVAVQEQDDVSVPERLELEVEQLESQPDVGIVCGVAAWMDDTGTVFAHFPGILHRGEPYPQDTAGMVRYLYVEQCKIANATCMFRRSVCDGLAEPFDPDARMSIDWRFFLDVAHRHRVVGLSRVLTHMRRGSSHESLTRRKELQFREARRCIWRVYEHYRQDPGSPIDYWLYRRAMSTEMVLEGRYYGRVRGLVALMRAIVWEPTNRRAWRSARELIMRGVSKPLDLTGSGRR